MAKCLPKGITATEVAQFVGAGIFLLPFLTFALLIFSRMIAVAKTTMQITLALVGVGQLFEVGTGFAVAISNRPSCGGKSSKHQQAAGDTLEQTPLVAAPKNTGRGWFFASGLVNILSNGIAFGLVLKSIVDNQIGTPQQQEANTTLDNTGFPIVISGVALAVWLAFFGAFRHSAIRAGHKASLLFNAISFTALAGLLVAGMPYAVLPSLSAGAVCCALSTFVVFADFITGCCKARRDRFMPGADHDDQVRVLGASATA